MPEQPVLIVVAGPTAVGKTDMAIGLARHLGTDIISADSRQCYQGMAIGTAQPTAEERARAFHYFVDCFPPGQSVSAADFERLALQYLQDIFKKSPYAVVCGGTGLYIKALCEGLDEMPAVDAGIERTVNSSYEALGIAWLRAALQQEDTVFFATGETDNPARMLRALAFIRSTGKSITAFRSGTKKERPFRILKIGLDLPRELLYERINRRVDGMMEQGLEEEVRALLPERHARSLNTVGYAELFDYFDGKTGLAEAIDKIKQHSRNYAKRQLTWFKKDREFHWFSPGPDTLQQIIALL